MSISPLALVHPNAQLGADVVIEAFATVEEDVVIGDHGWIASHARINDGSRIGDHVKVFQGAVVGSDPQDLKYKGETTELHLGHHVTIREYSTINRGTMASGVTSIGDHVLVMAYTHVAHDCQIDHHAILANSVNLAGHVNIGEYAIIGGMTAVQQFLTIGRHAFIGGGTLIRKDVPPYIKAAREPLSYIGVNTVGLGRRDFSREDQLLLQDIYRILFVKHTNVTHAMAELLEKYDMSDPYINEVTDFIKASKNGIIKGLRQQV